MTARDETALYKGRAMTALDDAGFTVACPRCGKPLKVVNVETSKQHRTQYSRCVNKRCPITDVAETIPLNPTVETLAQFVPARERCED